MSSYRSRIFLIETVVVLITISLIFSFGLHRYHRLVQKSFQVEAFHQFRNIKMAQSIFSAENGRFARSFEELQRSVNYVAVFQQTHFDYTLITKKNNYLIKAVGKRHTPVNGVTLLFDQQGLVEEEYDLILEGEV